MGPVSTSPKQLPATLPGGGRSASHNSAVLQELDKILASASFRGSPPLRRFLRYSVEHSLQGEGDQLKEYRLGVDVFGRRSSYDPRKDPVVRLEARRLRAKLREYYEDEGRRDPVRIDVPKGRYAATFAANGHRELPAPEPGPVSRSAKIGILAAICVVALLLVGWAIGQRRRQQPGFGSSQIASIAVLPFQNLSDDPTQEYLADGITGNLIDNLSQLPGLRVIARGTVFRYKAQDSDPQKVGRELHVDAVLTGKLRDQAGTVVVQAELLDAASGSSLWEGQYNRKLTEIQSVPEDISREISGRLQVRLTGEERARLTERPTEDTDAFQLYLRGRYNWNKRTEEGFTKALAYFDQAIEKDPEYALAYAGRADSYVLLAEYTVIPSEEALPKARDAATKALALNETLGEAHASLGAVKVDYEWDWQGAERDFRRAIELNPSYATAHQWYAELLSQQGRYEEAVAEIKRAQELEPLSLIINAVEGRILLFGGLVDPAIEQLQKTLDIDPNFSIASYDLGKAYLRKGMLEEAIAEFQKSVNLFKVSERDAALAYAYTRAGKDTAARNLLETYLQQSRRTYVSWYGMAFIYTGLGDKDRAFDCLEKAYDEHDTRLRDLKVEPLFVSLHLDPRFAHLVRRIGLQP